MSNFSCIAVGDLLLLLVSRQEKSWGCWGVNFDLRLDHQPQILTEESVSIVSNLASILGLIFSYSFFNKFLLI